MDALTPLLVVTVVATGALVGLAARALLRRWRPERVRRTTLAEAVIVGMLGAAIGQATATALVAASDGSRVVVELGLGVAAAVLFSVLGLLLVAWGKARREDLPADALLDRALAAGESDRVEFKSSARYNRHTGGKDARLERVLGKTVCAFANTEGGLLLIGVDDEGTVLGLDDDLALAKLPDLDRFELYLRDAFGRMLGSAAAARLRIGFAYREGRAACLVRVPPSPTPVFLAPAGDDVEEFWVRSGNSSRRLGPADMIDYYRGHRAFGRRLR